jgi:hypothetical protein
MTGLHDKALEFDCPVCDAKPREECHRVDGHVMPLSHSARRNLVLGIKHPTRREEVTQAVVRTDTKKKSDPH